jgi:hypothetical protein
MSSLISLSFNATVPEGYALRGTANGGQANTHTPSGPYDYHCFWSAPFRMPSLPQGAKQFVDDRQAQQSALAAQFQKLQDQGAIEVILDEPLLIFSITNKPGDVFQGFLELIGPPGSANKASPPKPLQDTSTNSINSQP